MATFDRVTFAATGNVEGRTLSGVAYAFGTRTLRGNRYLEFAPTAFDAALARSDPRAFVNHNTDLLLGRMSNGTVRVAVEPDGLHYAIDVPDTTYGNDLLVSVARGDMSEMSFGITPGKFTLQKAADGKRVEVHTAVDELFDVSPVSMPAFGGTSVQLHSAGSSESQRSQLAKARHRARNQ